ncbi:MAG: CYTH domain-containing protein [Candidatus Eisenbacteria sp.]|nr:CYTH domain-containing protein [Candidatus Eisenbacteria bacterium]
MTQEREFKVQLTEEGAQRLEQLLGPPARTVFQRNHYLDTPDGLLRTHHYGLRLREESLGPRPTSDRRFILTLKGPSITSGALVERLEEEIELNGSTAQRILEEGLDPRGARLDLLGTMADRFGMHWVACLGCVTNERRVFLVRLTDREEPHELELDRTLFPDGSVGYEAELELPPGPKAEVELPPGPPAEIEEQALRELLASAGLPWTPSRSGKYTRFLQCRGQA